MIKKYIKGVFSTGIGTAVSIAIGFINLIIAVRILNKEVIGFYILSQVIINFCVMMGDIGLSGSTIVFMSGRTKIVQEQGVNSVFVFKIVIGVFISLLLAMSGRVIFFLFKSQRLNDFIGWLPILFISEFIFQYFMSLLQGCQLFRKIAITQIILSILNCGLTIFLLLALRLDIHGLFLGRIAALLATIIFQYNVMPIKVAIYFSYNLFRKIFIFGFPLGLNGLLTFGFKKIDMILISMFLSPLGVASYGIASRIPEAFSQMFESLRSVFFPSMAELFNLEKKEEALKLLNSTIRLVAFSMFTMALIIALFKSEIITLLFSAKYSDSAPILGLLMFSVSIGLVGNIMGTSLVAAGYSRLPVVINIVDAAVSISLNIILIPKLGILGAALAAILARCAANPVIVFFLRKMAINVSSSVYVKLIILSIFCMGLSVVGGHSIQYKILVALLFVIVCEIWSIFSFNDLKRILSHLGVRTWVKSENINNI